MNMMRRNLLEPEKAQHLRALVALAEDLVYIPTTYILTPF